VLIQGFFDSFVKRGHPAAKHLTKVLDLVHLLEFLHHPLLEGASFVASQGLESRHRRWEPDAYTWAESGPDLVGPDSEHLGSGMSRRNQGLRFTDRAT
jgi:hypothetical protein